MRRISVAKDFSQFPGGRRREDGPFSGEAFREDVLIPALKQGPVEVALDGTLGYASNWLEEVFGGLRNEFTLTELEHNLFVGSSDTSLVTESLLYMEKEVYVAARRKTNSVARKEALIEAAELCENGARTYEVTGHEMAANALRITAKELRSRAEKEK